MKIFWKGTLLSGSHESYHKELVALDLLAARIVREYRIPFVNATAILSYIPRYLDVQDNGDRPYQLYTQDRIHHGGVDMLISFVFVGVVLLDILLHTVFFFEPHSFIHSFTHSPALINRSVRIFVYLFLKPGDSIAGIARSHNLTKVGSVSMLITQRILGAVCPSGSTSQYDNTIANNAAMAGSSSGGRVSTNRMSMNSGDGDEKEIESRNRNDNGNGNDLNSNSGNMGNNLNYGSVMDTAGRGMGMGVGMGMGSVSRMGNSAGDNGVGNNPYLNQQQMGAGPSFRGTGI